MPTLMPIADGRLLKERAYTAIRAAIVRLELKPGEPLTERVLSARLGVSKSPIRDALIQLEAEGLVRSTPFKGFVVTPLTADALRHTMQLKEALALYSVEQCTRRSGPAELVALEKVHREHRRSIDGGAVDAAWETQGRFIELLFEALANPLIVGANRVIEAHILRLRNLARTIPGRLEKTYAEQKLILDAIRRRDAEQAQHLMRGHFRSLIDDLLGSDAVAQVLNSDMISDIDERPKSARASTRRERGVDR